MEQKLMTNILNAIADAKGIEPTKMEYVLADYIDLDAIEQLAAHDSASWTLSFDIPDHTVTVTSDGLIFVDGARKEIWP